MTTMQFDIFQHIFRFTIATINVCISPTIMKKQCFCVDEHEMKEEKANRINVANELKWNSLASGATTTTTDKQAAAELTTGELEVERFFFDYNENFKIIHPHSSFSITLNDNQWWQFKCLQSCMKTRNESTIAIHDYFIEPLIMNCGIWSSSYNDAATSKGN